MRENIFTELPLSEWPQTQMSEANQTVRHVQNFHFKIGDKVCLREIERPGIVTALLEDSTGSQYRVCYWAEANRKVEWVYQEEIEFRGACENHTGAVAPPL